MGVLLVGVVIGSIAAVGEVLMVRTYEKDRVVLLAIATHWMGVGVLMPFVDLGLPIWLTGTLVGACLTIPFIILAVRTSRNAIIHTSIFAPTWGIAIAYGCAYLA